MNDDYFEIPIEGVLDLHTFSPKDVKELIPEYLRLCKEKGIREVKLIHGKGKGILKEFVRKQLQKIPFVSRFVDAELSDGGWGATIVFLE